MKAFNQFPRYVHPEESSRRRDLSRSKNNLAVYSAEETVYAETWPIQNSPLLETKDSYHDLSYERTFKELLPEGVNLKEFIETGLGEKNGRAVGIDIGGLGSEVFAGFTPGFFERTAGVALVDSRALLDIDVAKDEASHHSVIAGDFFQSSTRKSILDWLGGQKADLIFERMQGGLELVPRDERIVATGLETMYASLSDVGMMFIQLNFRIHSDLKYGLLDMHVVSIWGNEVMKQPNPGLHVGIDSRGDCILIQKLKGAPPQLPHLDTLRSYGARARNSYRD